MLSAASQAEITVFGSFLRIRDGTAFPVFNILFTFWCDSKSFALQHPGFPATTLSSIKLFWFWP